MFREFLFDDDGAVTVDWVVLTAALVGLGLAALAVTSEGVGALANETSDVLEDDDIVGTSNFALASYDPFNFGAYQRMDPNHHTGNWTHLNASYLPNASIAQIETQMVQGADLAANGGTQQIQAWGVDVYAASYAQMQSRGEDVSGYTHPQEYIDSYQAQYGG